MRYEYYITGGDSIVNTTNEHPQGMTFTPAIAHTISSVKLYMYRQGTSAGTSYVRLYATAAGLPTGSPLATCTFEPNSVLGLEAGAAWITFNLDTKVALSAGTMYAIVYSTPNAASGNFIAAYADSSSPIYTGGCYVYSLDSGSTWATFDALDILFEELSDDSGLFFCLG